MVRKPTQIWKMTNCVEEGHNSRCRSLRAQCSCGSSALRLSERCCGRCTQESSSSRGKEVCTHTHPFRPWNSSAGDRVTSHTPATGWEVERTGLCVTTRVYWMKKESRGIWLLVGNADYSVTPNNHSCY